MRKKIVARGPVDSITKKNILRILGKCKGVEILSATAGKLVFIWEQEKHEFYSSLQFLNEKMLAYGYRITVSIDLLSK